MKGKTIAIVNQKGGVGKTNLMHNPAYVNAEEAYDEPSFVMIEEAI